ncbi:MAG: hypothetical protein ACLP56_16150 [Candidatus Sulfotelmatobacter sp.]
MKSGLRRYIREKLRAHTHGDDLERINRAADQLNSEVEDVLEYQASDDSASMERDEQVGPA